MPLHALNSRTRNALLTDVYASDPSAPQLPKHRLRDGSVAPSVAYSLVRDELILDGNSRQNLATFCTTWMEPEVRQLMADSVDKNMIDKDEYPQTAEIESRCVHILADLWHAPEAATTIGCSTTGSSEAAMLGGLALKWQWRKRRAAAGKSADRPNLVCGPVQVCWEKFARYFDVELRQIPLKPEATGMIPEQLASYCDENTVGVVPTLGITFTGGLRAGREDCRSPRRHRAKNWREYPHPCRCRERRVHRSVHPAGSEVGLPPRTCEVRPTNATDIITLGLAIATGYLVGLISIPIAGIPVGLGTMGGIVVAGMVVAIIRSINPALGGPMPEGARAFLESIGVDLFVTTLGLTVAPALVTALSQGLSTLFVLVLGVACATVPTFISWLVGLYILRMDPIILAGAVAGARNSTTAMRAISDKSKSSIPSFGYPVTYALSTVVFLIYGYLAILLT